MKVKVYGAVTGSGDVISGEDLPKWTHYVCDSCYENLEPGRVPFRAERVGLKCCRCGETTDSGIWYVSNPVWYLCKGAGEVHNAVD